MNLNYPFRRVNDSAPLPSTVAFSKLVQNSTVEKVKIRLTQRTISGRVGSSFKFDQEVSKSTPLDIATSHFGQTVFFSNPPNS